MVSGAVVVSSQTTSVRAANLLASFIIIPMAFLIQGESVVMFWARYDVLWLAILGLIVIAGLLIRTGVAHFNREELLGRELDSLNLKAGWRVFIKSFIGQARSPLQWYRLEVVPTLRRLRIPVVMMVLALILAVWAGVREASQFVLPAEIVDLRHLNGGFIEGLEALSFFSPSGVGVVWLHNLRAVMLATLAGIFSFGVLGIIILMLPLALISYIMANVAAAGFSPGLFFASLVLPHGILEIPAMILAGAAILGLGGTLAVPAPDRTIGEAWLHALADWAKIMVGLVIPLLMGAALIEVFVTPRLAILLLGG